MTASPHRTDVQSNPWVEFDLSPQDGQGSIWSILSWPFGRISGSRMLTSRMSLLLLAALTARSVTLDEKLSLLAKDVSASLGPKQVHRLAVVDFVLLTGEETTVTKYLTEQFTTHLVSGTRAFQVVDRSNLNAILAESDQQQRLARDGLMNPATVSKLGVAGVDAVLLGKVTVLASTLTINLKVLDVQTADVHVMVKADIEIRPNSGRPNSNDLNILAPVVQAAPQGKETSEQKRIRQETEKADKRRDNLEKRTSIGLRNAAISGCPNGSVSLDLRAVDTSAGGWLGLRGAAAKIRIINLHSSPVDISDESGTVIRDLCPGGGITLFRALSSFTDGTNLQFRYIATGKFGDGSLGKQQSQTIDISNNRPGIQNLTWEVQLQKVYTQR